MEILKDAFLQMFEVPPATALTYFFCLLAGILVNWVWKCKREKLDPIEYWTNCPRSAMLTFFVAISTFITTMIVEPGLGKQTYFAMGIACDAMLHKPPLPPSVQAALQRANESMDSDNIEGIVGAKDKKV